MNTARKGLLVVVALAGVLFSTAAAQNRSLMMVLLTLDPNRPVLSQDEIDSLQTAHMANIQRMAREGKLLIAGPFGSGGGIFVLSTESKDTARMWLNTDPAVRSKRWIIESYPYIPRIGNICVVAVKYEMVTYNFVRFEWRGGNVENQLLTLVDPELIVGAGSLEGSGTVVITRNDVDQKALSKETLVRDGNIKVTVNKLWIAKGSFCED
jgi:uncharacterized protein YciI